LVDVDNDRLFVQQSFNTGTTERACGPARDKVAVEAIGAGCAGTLTVASRRVDLDN
jgi:hypothetical protein